MLDMHPLRRSMTVFIAEEDRVEVADARIVTMT